MLAKKALIIYSSQAVAVLASLALSLFLVNIGQKDWVGQFLYFLTINTIVINLLTSPLGMWLTRLRGQVDNRYDLVAVMQLWTRLSVFMALASSTLFALGYVYLGIWVLYVALGVICSSYTYEWNSNDSYKLYGLGTSFVPMSRLAFVAISLWCWPQKMTAEIAATASYFLVFAVMLGVSKWQGEKGLPRPVLSRLKLRKQNGGWSLAINMSVSSLVYSCYQSLDKTLTKGFFGSEKVAELIITQQWSYVIVTTAMQPLIAVLYPSILQGKLNILDLCKSNVFYTAVTAIIVFLGCYSLQLILLQIIPNNYVNNKWWLWGGMISGVLFMAGQILSINFSKEGFESKHAVSVLVPTVVIAPVMYILIRNYEVAGAILSGFLFSLVYLVTCFSLSTKKNEFRQ